MDPSYIDRLKGEIPSELVVGIPSLPSLKSERPVMPTAVVGLRA